MKKLAGNKYLIKDDKTLTIDKIPICDFLKRSNTPMMIFLEDKLRENITSFIEVFDSVFSNFKCFYCNYNLYVFTIKSYTKLLCNFDTSNCIAI